MKLATQKREGRPRNGLAENQNQQQMQDRGFVLPEANIVETKDAFIVTVEMPGVNADGLEITLENNVLAIIGRRKDAPVSGTVLIRESRPQDFRRVFEVAPSIETGNIQARMNQGVLTLELPKAEKVKPRKIAVSA